MWQANVFVGLTIALIQPAAAHSKALIGMWDGYLECAQGKRSIRTAWFSLEDSDDDLAMILLPPAYWNKAEDFRVFRLSILPARVDGMQVLRLIDSNAPGYATGLELRGRFDDQDTFRGDAHGFDGCPTFILRRSPVTLSSGVKSG